MKKIINEPSNFVEESIEGLVKSHPDIYAFAPDNKRVIVEKEKVVIICSYNSPLKNFDCFSSNLSKWVEI